MTPEQEQAIRDRVQTLLHEIMHPIVQDFTDKLAAAICQSFEEGYGLGISLKDRIDVMNTGKNEENEPLGKYCPICGKKMICDQSKVLTSNPAMYEYKCPNCGNIQYDFRNDL